MHRVLLVTDDGSRKKPLKSELLERSFTVTLASSAEVLDERFTPPDRVEVVVVDFERCGVDTLRLCHAVRRERLLKELPLIVLLTEEQLGRVELGPGVDDYLTLPVSGKRLVERIQFLLQKLHRATPKNGFSHGGLLVDFERYEVHVDGDPVDLTYKEFELLKFLALHPGKPFTREALLDKVWGYDYYGGTRTVDVHIRRLRAKIEAGGALYIETVRNVGYKFLGEPPAETTRGGASS